MKQIAIVILTLISTIAYAQKGTIRGTVYDGSTGETLVGVSVVIKGTYIGAATDLDGQFSIETEPGTYDLQLSFISFQPLTIEGVEVKPNEVTLLNNLQLNESTVELEDVVVTAKAIRNTEAALQTMKRKSTVMLDGISAAKMELIGDGNAVEAAKRVTGVTVEDGKYIYVRGLGDRYSKTTLNNVDIPGLDPDRNSLQMDIFPTNLIDNMMVSKNFTADMPADFTGGLLNVTTKDFPEKKIFNVSAGTAFNPDVHFNDDFLTYDGGDTDFLGFDDGTRDLPDRARQPNIPTPVSGAPLDEVVDFIRSFNPQLAAKRQTSLLDYSLGLSVGNQINLDAGSAKAPKLGYIFSLSYKSEYGFDDAVQYGEYQKSIDPDTYEMRYATLQNGEMGERNVLVGLLGGIAYKTNFNKIRFTAMHLQNGVSRAGKFSIDNDASAVGQSGFYAESDNLEYNQRSLTNLLLHGTHVFQASGWEIDWRLSPTFSTSDDPDIRKTAFTFRSNNDVMFNAGAGGNPTRIWRELSETNASAKVDATKEYQLGGEDATLKFGFNYNYKQRDYEILLFDIQFFGGQSWDEPDASQVLNPENLYPNKPNSIYYQSGNNNPNPNAYKSNVNNTAVYLSNEFSPFSNFKTILGVRMENYVQRHTGRDQRYASGDTQNGRNLDNDKVLESLDFFPSVNLIYALSEQQNLRASWSQTIARPSFKELSFAQILDPISNRIFNGSLFPYSDWDGNLEETHINNMDVRWELFGDRAQNISASVFYKQFDKPIELVRIPEQQTSTEYQPRNVGDGQLYGFEFEFSKNLDFASPLLRHFNVNGNLTLVKSEIEMTDAEYNSRKTYEKTGETVDDTREMAGQSPWVVNAGLTYNNYESGLAAGLFYNVKGETLSIVGAGLFPDIYIESFHSLNFSLNKKFGEEQNTKVELKVSNILDESKESYYQSYKAENQVYNIFNPGRTFSLGLSYAF
ncbi:TonB-dependent receptor [Anaerophaga thermohalophila]|uniref:TonB-dependent receptor n=1 Tax=Anaerophaga thermohalophila TaxID=177400 RepID=UPI000237C66A|nr:TonB-dependent receptor [Anaerophaga thermohalophila]